MGRGEKRYRAKLAERLAYLEKRDRRIRECSAVMGTGTILMAIGWNQIAYLCNKTYLLSFTYNEGWGLFQSGMIFLGTLLIVLAVLK